MLDHSKRLQIITTLADGQFHSGQKLGEILGVSRAAVNKQIQGLKEWGIDIYRVQGKGYQLSRPMELLEAHKLNCGSVPVELIPVIDSTNQYIKDRAETLQSGHACVAELQLAGRGRRGRAWYSPFGCNLYLSLYWRLEAGLAAAMGLSLAVGIIAAETLREQTGADVRVKWPNDLYVNDKKLAGILVELSGQAGETAHVIVGMGINMAMPTDIDTPIDQPWTSVADVGQNMPSRNELLASLIERLREGLAHYEREGLAAFTSRWNLLDNYIDRRVTLIIGPNTVSGIARGINEQGALLLENENGDITPYIGGEISLRGNDAVTD
uniref:bifunctional biotin--[acetyl-CoA-carboxylase] ligase/biotin operon repressor BirA n=1 Tax=Thaumasiovibrio occultus TaxID=1891184 RepID=UPI000B363B7E|nr:bifunctional biotin--[acetyl-CoA-carboxylase] ligase/biotin operon repressor BirA [Thaumasiovibrio occultus]